MYSILQIGGKIMENLEKLQLACQKYGKTGLARQLNISAQAIFKALRERRGLRPIDMLEIDKLLADICETTQGTTQEQSTLSQLERLILDNVHKMTEQAQAEVLAVTLDILKNPNNLTSK